MYSSNGLYMDVITSLQKQIVVLNDSKLLHKYIDLIKTNNWQLRFLKSFKDKLIVMSVIL